MTLRFIKNIVLFSYCSFYCAEDDNNFDFIKKILLRQPNTTTTTNTDSKIKGDKKEKKDWFRINDFNTPISSSTESHLSRKQDFLRENLFLTQENTEIKKNLLKHLDDCFTFEASITKELEKDKKISKEISFKINISQLLFSPFMFYEFLVNKNIPNLKQIVEVDKELKNNTELIFKIINNMLYCVGICYECLFEINNLKRKIDVQRVNDTLEKVNRIRDLCNEILEKKEEINELYSKLSINMYGFSKFIKFNTPNDKKNNIFSTLVGSIKQSIEDFDLISDEIINFALNVNFPLTTTDQEKIFIYQDYLKQMIGKNSFLKKQIDETILFFHNTSLEILKQSELSLYNKTKKTKSPYYNSFKSGVSSVLKTFCSLSLTYKSDFKNSSCSLDLKNNTGTKLIPEINGIKNQFLLDKYTQKKDTIKFFASEMQKYNHKQKFALRQMDILLTKINTKKSFLKKTKHANLSLEQKEKYELELFKETIDFLKQQAEVCSSIYAEKFCHDILVVLVES